MKKIAVALILFAATFSAGAQHFDWNVNFDYLFRNYEYDRSGNVYDDSYTLHAARLTPEAGLLIKQKSNVFHRLRAGIDIFKEMGEGRENIQLFREMLLYYNVEAAFSNGGRFEAVAGCFPRRFSEGDFVGPYFDDDIIFYDNNLEGMFFKYRNRHIFAELGLDWPGMLGDIANPSRRERFQVLSSGLWNFAGPFNFGWTGSFYHFACSPESPNVVDNHMLNPYLEWQPFSFMDVLRISVGGIFTYQCDRMNANVPVFPMGFYSRQTFGKWGIVVDNHFYYGDDLMPFYDYRFTGDIYGRELYMGDLGFRTRFGRPSWADYFRLKYEPRLTNWLDLSIALSFYFGEASEILGTPVYRGCQQSVALRFNLDVLRPHPRAPKGRERGFYLGGFTL